MFIRDIFVEVGLVIGVNVFIIGFVVGVGVKGLDVGVDVIKGLGFVVKFIKLIIFLELICLIIGFEVVVLLLFEWFRFCDCVWFGNLIWIK